MKLFVRNMLVLGLASMLAFSGCAKYKSQPLPKLQAIVEEKKDVEVSAQALTERECRKAFSRRILNKGYQPIQLIIKNKSRYTYILDAANIELQLEPTQLVAKQLHLNTAGRVVSWAAAGLFIWPFYIAAAVEGCRSSDANRELNHDFAQRTISDESRIYIHPGSMINKVIFVTTDNFRNKFNLRLFSKEHDELLDFEVRI